MRPAVRRPGGVADQIAVEGRRPEVTLKVALTLAPDATGSANVFDAPVDPETTELHPAGAERLNVTPAADAPVYS